MIDKDNKILYMQLRESKVIHLQIEENSTRQTQQPRFKLFNQTYQGSFNRKNTRNSHRIQANSSEKMSKTGRSFYQRQPTVSRQRRISSSQKTSLSCSAIVNKPMLPIPILTQSCLQFSTKTKAPDKSHKSRAILYDQISRHNQKLLSKVYLFQGEHYDCLYKRQNTLKSYLQWLRFEQMRHKKEIRDQKIGNRQLKRKDVKRKGFNCIFTHKKMRENVLSTHGKPMAKWKKHRCDDTEEIDVME